MTLINEEFLDDELQQMEEREREGRKPLERAVSVRDPIRRLTLQKMTVVPSKTTLADALKAMQKGRTGCLLVCRGEKLAGIFTERDVIHKVVGKGLDHSREVVDDYMTGDPDVLHQDDSIAFALNRMYDGGYRHIPIVDDKRRPIGVCGVLDIISHLAVFYSADVLNLPPKPARDPLPRPEGG